MVDCSVQSWLESADQMSGAVDRYCLSGMMGDAQVDSGGLCKNVNWPKKCVSSEETVEGVPELCQCCVLQLPSHIAV